MRKEVGDLLVTSIWVLGLCLIAGALGHALDGPAGAVIGVGLVLFLAGLAADVWGLL